MSWAALEPIWQHLRCPGCGSGPLRRQTAPPALDCVACGAGYPAPGGIPRLLPEAVVSAACRRARQPLPGVAAWLAHLDAHTRARILPPPPPPDGQPHRDPAHIRAVRNYLRFGSGDRGGILLDVGAGTLERRPHFPHLTYVALDPLPPAGAAAETGGVACLQAAAERIPLAGGTVARVLAAEVLPYVLDPGRVLAELVRVLRPGGHLYLFIPQQVPAAARLAPALPPEWYRQRLAPHFQQLEWMEDSGYHYGWGWQRLANSRGEDGP